MNESLNIAAEIEGKTFNHNGRVAISSEKEEAEELNRQSKHIQELMERIDEMQDSDSRSLMQQCVSELLSFYGKGLERILSLLTQDGSDASTKIYNRLIDDSFVSGLLLIHDLHPLDLQTRLNFALQKVRPYMDSHGGNVELVSLENGIARLRLSGSCKGCASSSVTLELAIKQAIEENCPDLIRLDVEGVVESAPKNNQTTSNCHHAAQGWKTLNDAESIINGTMKFFEVNGTQLIVCRVNDQLYSYRNSCPACEMTLSSGTIEKSIIRCRLGHQFDLQLAGKCTDDESLHLDPFPLLVENGVIKVAVG